MRVYVPSTIPALAAILRTGQVRAGMAYAVTPALREAYASGDTEELEYVALIAAARGSLRLLADDPEAPSRRVVLAADVHDDRVTWTGQQAGADPAAVTVTVPIPVAKLVSAHIDDPQAAQDIRQAVAALPAADAGDADAGFEVDQAEGHELGWYATQELPDQLR
jgi:predicted aminopeptidase